MRLADGPRDRAVAQADDAHEAPALILDALADAEAGRVVGAEVEAVAEHPGKGTSINVGVPVDTEIAYGRSGGPWTMTSDGKAQLIWTGYENAGSPLRKSLELEIETNQEGDDGAIEGTGEIAFDVSALAGTATAPFIGSGSVAFAVSTLAGTGQVPYSGTGAVQFTTAFAGTGTVPYAGTGEITAAAALAGTGTISSTGTGNVTAAAALAGSGTMTLQATEAVSFGVQFVGTGELSDTARQIKHFEEFSNVERFLDLT